MMPERFVDWELQGPDENGHAWIMIDNSGFNLGPLDQASEKFLSLTTASIKREPLAGEVQRDDRFFPYPTKEGWLRCDGAEVPRAAYSQLFAVFGTAYGSGDGSTTFNLPDTSPKPALIYPGAGKALADAAGEDL